MKRDEERKKIVFKDDGEFYDFAVKESDSIVRTENGTLMFTWEFTSSYDKALADGYILEIEDPNSQVVKNRVACYRTVCRPVEVQPAEYRGLKH